MKTTTAAKLVIVALIALFGIIAMTSCKKKVCKACTTEYTDFCPETGEVNRYSSVKVMCDDELIEEAGKSRKTQDTINGKLWLHFSNCSCE